MSTPQPRRCPARPPLPPRLSVRHGLRAAALAFALGLGACDRVPTTPAPTAPAAVSPALMATASSGSLVTGNNCPPGYTNNGLTCGRGAETIPNSRAADCPSGYTNTGISCFRPAHTTGNGGATTANCPSGYTNTGASCFRPAHTTGNGGVVAASCPSGFTNMGLTCHRWWPPLTLGLESMTCPDGMFRSGGLCYRHCPQGYTNTGISCFRPASTLSMSSMTCPAGRYRSGGLCYLPCPTGYTNTGSSCFREASTLPVSSMTCRPDESRSGARCFKPCPVGYTNTGLTCFRPASTVPRNSDIDWNPALPMPRQKFYNIAHMANTAAAASWALAQGANGLEMDLRFTRDGIPSAFMHGGSCDCNSCPTTPDNICRCLDGSCNASSNPSAHLRYIARLSGVALVYIDSKVDRETHPQAGTEVIRLLERDLFGAGYRGVVIVSAPEVSDAAYLRAAVLEAGKGPNARRYFFGFDMVRGPASTGLDVLQQIPGSPNLVYSTGITACLAWTFYSEISGAVAQRWPGRVSLTGIWTLDREESMIHYLQLGVNAIITNRPGVLKTVLAQTRPDLVLAAPGDSPPLRR